MFMHGRNVKTGNLILVKIKVGFVDTRINKNEKPHDRKPPLGPRLQAIQQSQYCVILTVVLIDAIRADKFRRDAVAGTYTFFPPSKTKNLIVCDASIYL